MHGSESCVRVSQGHTGFFNVDSGVRQRDSLSPLLFNIVLYFVMKKVKLAGDGIEWTVGRRLRDLAYTDDIYLLADYIADMRRMTEAVICEAALVGLRVNTRKTEIVKIRTNGARKLSLKTKAFTMWKSLCISDVRYARTKIFEMRWELELARLAQRSEK